MNVAARVESLYDATLAQFLSPTFGFLLLTWLAVATYYLHLHPLARIPGPKIWILSRLPYIWALRKGQLAVRLKELHEAYGSVVRVAANEVSFIDEKAWTDIYAYHQHYPFPKNPYWYRMRPNKAYGIMASPNAEHGRFRRTYAPAFTEKAVREQEPLILRHIETLIDHLKVEALKKVSINIVNWFEYIAFDIVGDLSYSHSFDCLKEKDNRYQITIVQDSMKGFTLDASLRLLGVEKVKQLYIPMISPKRQEKYYKTLNYWTQQRLAEGETHQGNDLMKYANLRTNKGLTLPETENSIGDMMIAGSETVASTLAAVFYHLTRSPSAYQDLAKELRGKFNRQTEINVSAVSDLPFLNAVINETMRLCPSLPMVMPRVVPEPGAQVCGYWLPAGTQVSFCQLAAYSSPKNFSFPERFIPSRWLPTSTMKLHNAGVFHPFSVGQRNCIGKEFGLAEVRLILAKLLWNFDITAGEKDWDWNSQKTYHVWEKRPLFVNISPRCL